MLLQMRRRQNLLPASEVLTGWTFTNAQAATDGTLAPDGSTLVYDLNESNTTNGQHLAQRIITGGMRGPLTASCYMKANERTTALLRMLNGSSATIGSTNVNLSNGTFTLSAVGTSYGGIVAKGGGWYYVWVTADNDTDNLTVRLIINQVANYAGVVGNGIYVTRVQVNRSSRPRGYARTV